MPIIESQNIHLTSINDHTSNMTRGTPNIAFITISTFKCSWMRSGPITICIHIINIVSYQDRLEGMCMIHFDQYKEQFKWMRHMYTGLGYGRTPIMMCISDRHASVGDKWKQTLSQQVIPSSVAIMMCVLHCQRLNTIVISQGSSCWLSQGKWVKLCKISSPLPNMYLLDAILSNKSIILRTHRYISKLMLLKPQLITPDDL